MLANYLLLLVNYLYTYCMANYLYYILHGTLVILLANCRYNWQTINTAGILSILNCWQIIYTVGRPLIFLKNCWSTLNTTRSNLTIRWTKISNGFLLYCSTIAIIIIIVIIDFIVVVVVIIVVFVLLLLSILSLLLVLTLLSLLLVLLRLLLFLLLFLPLLKYLVSLLKFEFS